MQRDWRSPDESLLSTASSNTLVDLDVLSQASMVNWVGVEVLAVDAVDDTHVFLSGSGSLHVELNYGKVGD